MKTAIVIFILTMLSLAGGAQAAKCKFEIEEADQIESRLLLLFRGGLVGLSGHFGLRNGKPYLKAHYGSNFKARAQFSEDTPLELHLADGRNITLDVISDASAELQFGHIITGSRVAQPLFAITAPQWDALLESPIVRLHMAFDAKGERRSETRDVKDKHAKRIMAALECIVQEGHAISPVEPAP